MSNPVFNEERWNEAANDGTVATVNGTIKKTAFFLVILLLTFGATWDSLERTKLVFGMVPMYAIIGSAIGGFVMVLISMFAPRASPVVGTIYALCEGVLLAGFSWFLTQSNPKFQGLPLLAAVLTFGTLIGMLLLYTQRIIRATPMFIKVVVGMTVGLMLGIGLLMLLNVFGMATGIREALYGSGWIGIGFSLLCVGLGAFNLVLDFHFIESAQTNRAPKYFEWVGALGLLVTLVWLYLEILRLLAKLRSR